MCFSTCAEKAEHTTTLHRQVTELLNASHIEVATLTFHLAWCFVRQHLCCVRCRFRELANTCVKHTLVNLSLAKPAWRWTNTWLLCWEYAVSSHQPSLSPPALVVVESAWPQRELTNSLVLSSCQFTPLCGIRAAQRGQGNAGAVPVHLRETKVIKNLKLYLT